MFVVVLGIATVTVPQSLLAQAPCPHAWQPGDGIPGLDGVAYAMANWDPDGAGPQPEVVVVGGQFTVAGDQLVGNVALYDPTLQRWSPLGTGLDRVNTILVRGGTTGGQLVVGTNSGVRAWNGTVWQALGPSFDNSVNQLVELANGQLVAGGAFGLIGASPIVALARWNGTQWQAMGNPSLPVGNGTIRGLDVLPNGHLVAGGAFVQVGGVACSHVARWDGTTWFPLGAGSSLPVSGLQATSAGDVVALGLFLGGSTSGARWNGSNWSALPAGAPGGWFPIASFGSNGVLCRAASGLWAQDATGWTSLAAWTLPVDVQCAALLANGDALVGGSFVNLGDPVTLNGPAAWNVARRRNGVFGSANSGSSGLVLAAAPAADGGLFAVGRFSIGGLADAPFAHFDGAVWTGLPVPADSVFDVVARGDGSVLMAGAFTFASGHTLARWQNGVATPVLLPAGQSTTLLARGVGATYVAHSQFGAHRVSRWDGTLLSPLPLVAGGQLYDLVELPNGDLVLAGQFTTPLVARLLRWDGHQLQAIPGAPSGITTLAVAANGNLLVGGQLTAPFSSVARWDGTTWQALGSLPTNGASSIDTLPNGDVVLTQVVPGAPVVTRIQRWDGVQWTLLGEARGTARVVWSPMGELVAFGNFVRVDSAVSAVFARLQSSCPALVQDLGGGCSGSAGPLTTRVDERAWLGGTFHATTRGVPANALALGVFGGGAISLPLSQLLPIGGAGCTLRATPEIVGVAPVWNGEAQVALPLPSAPSLLGASFVQQTLVLESTAGTLTLLTASQALQLTIGAF